MSAHSNCTTSEVFVCASCLSPVSLQLINPDDLSYVCSNRRCKRAIHVNCPEGLALAEDAALILHARELRANIIAADSAGADPWNDVLALMKADPVFDIGIATLLETTMDIVKDERRRTATIEAMRLTPMVA